MRKLLICCILLICGIDFSKVLGNLEMDISKKLKEKNSTILSRKRRYLVFPEGSSFQIVFDLTYPSVGMGNAFVFGNTAAMGFELPSTPIFLDKKRLTPEEEEKSENNKTETVTEHLEHPVHYEHDGYSDYEEPIELLNSQENVPNGDISYDSTWTGIDRVPVTFYSSPFGSYINQKFTPVRYGNPSNYDGFYRKPSDFWTRRNFQNIKNKDSGRSAAMASIKNDMASFRKTVAHHVHRRSRRDIYTKIEKLFTVLSKNGKVCILKAICQVSKIPKNKGSMWEEILKAIFEVKPDDLYPDEDHYDRAANSNVDCEKMYPECEGHILSKIFRKKL